MQAKANLFRTLLMLPVLLAAVLLVASAPALGQEYYYPVTVPSPHDQETGVLRDTSVSLYFLGPLDQTTLTPDKFTLVKQGTTNPVEATVSYGYWCESEWFGSYYCAAVLDPKADLEAKTTYTATVKGGENGVKWASWYLGTPTMSEDYSWSFTTGDTTRPPETTITSGPCGPIYSGGDIYWLPCMPTTSTTATFAFTSSIANSTFECSLDSAAFTSSCTSPKAYTGVSDGTHTFQARATDASGNTDPTPAGRTWTVDTKAPSPPTMSLQNPTYDADGSFSVSGSAEANSTVELFEGTTSTGKTTQADSSSGAWSIDLSGVSEGAHTYSAKAKDAVSNTTSPASNSVTVKVDKTAPTVSSVSPASGARKVARNTPVTATFSEKMLPEVFSSTSSAVKLVKNGTTTPISATVSYNDSTKTVTITPSSRLAATTKYTVKLSPGLVDLAGNELAPYTWSFTTGST